MTTSEKPLPAGTKLLLSGATPSQLQLGPLLGKGAFASVWECTFLPSEGCGESTSSLPAVVALKVLLAKHDGSDDLQRQLFLREAQTLHTCKHPNVIKCYGLVKLADDFPGLQPEDGRLGLVLELSQVGSLHEYVASAMSRPKGSQPVYTAAQAVQWMHELASALDYLHTRNPLIIHRDIKLENVLLFPAPGPDNRRSCSMDKQQQQQPGAGDKQPQQPVAGQPEEGGRLVVKLADFGLHQRIESDRPVYLRRRLQSEAGQPHPQQQDVSTVGELHHSPTAPGARTTSYDQVPLGDPFTPTQASGASARFTEHDLFFTLDENGVARSAGSFLSPAALKKPNLAPLQRGSLGHAASHHTTGSSGTLPLPSLPDSVTAAHRSYSPLRQRSALGSGKMTSSPLRPSIQLSASAHVTPAAMEGEGGRRGSGSQQGRPSVAATHSQSSLGRKSMQLGHVKGPPSPRGIQRATSFRAPATLNAMSGKLLVTGRKHSIDGTEGSLIVTSGAFPDGASPSESVSGNSQKPLLETAGAGFGRGSLDPDPTTPNKNHHLLSLLDRSHKSRSVHGRSVHGQSPSRTHRGGGTSAAGSKSVQGDRSTHRLSFHTDLLASSYLKHVEDKSFTGRGTSIAGAMRQAARPTFETEFQAVFALTGETGSMLYMSPEVFKRQPYNASADVFSLALLGWELLAQRTLISMLADLDCSTTRQFAVEVSDGFRPRRPRNCPDAAWHLLCMCWDSDPVARPSTHQVKAELQRILHGMQSQQATLTAPPAGKQQVAQGKQSSSGCCVIA